MPQNFPEVWLNRVIQNLDEADMATFLEGIPELAVDVTVINEGQASEMNKIYVAATDFEVDVLINNNTYPIPFQAYNDDTIEITLDKYQTKVITLSDDDIMGASYDKIDIVTGASKRGILVNKYQKAIHSIAPAAETADTPIMEATGGPDALTDSDGRPRLTYEDLVAFKEATKHLKGEKRLVLNESHWNDLLLDRKRFADKIADHVEGKPAPKIAGFRMYEYDGDMPIFTSAKVKKPYGAIQDPTDKVASVMFIKTAIAKKTGLTKQYFAEAKSNPATQTNDLAYRHYYVAIPFQNKNIAAIL